MATTDRTRLLAVLGDPIAHSLSPLLHETLCRLLGLDYRSFAFRVAPQDLAAAVAGLRALGAAGFNVTVPHKEAILPLLDGLTPEAEALGAVNTVIREGRRLIGDNTDWQGFLAPLEARGFPLENRCVVVLGAGGAARAVVYALARRGAAQVTLVNRRPERAAALAHRARTSLGLPRARALALRDGSALRAALEKADLLVQTTPLGMWPRVRATPLPAELLRPELLVYDLVYRPLQTRLLREAAARGARTLGGLEMFLEQGIAALARWTGETPTASQRAAVRRVLEARLRRETSPQAS